MSSTINPVAVAPLVRAQRLAYVWFERPSLGRTEAFLDDFGIDRIELDGDRASFGSARAGDVFYVVDRGPRPAFRGFAVTVETEAELTRLVEEGFADRIEEDVTPARRPCVRLRDPSGRELHVVHVPSRDEVPASGAHGRRRNGPGQVRRIDAVRRAEAAAPRVARIGHVVLVTVDFRRCSGGTSEFSVSG